MSTEANKAITQRWLESLNNKGLDVADELLASNFVSYMPGFPEPMHGVEAFKQFVSVFWSAFPDFHHTAEEIIAEGDLVMIRWTAHGTHTGTLMSIPPTGKEITIAGVNIYRMADGKIVEEQSYYDQLSILQQLEVVPLMEVEH